jgi:DNA-binding PucR family transcriptional regulator
VVDRLRGKVSALESALGERCATLGVSNAVPLDGLPNALREARHARMLAEHQLDDAIGQAEVVAARQIAPHMLLLATLPTEVRRAFRHQLLHSLHEYDELHQSDLLRTLRTFLDLSCSWSRTAAQLHIHVNTLRYRVRRIEEISGKSLTVPADRIDLHLALGL